MGIFDGQKAREKRTVWRTGSPGTGLAGDTISSEHVKLLIYSI